MCTINYKKINRELRKELGSGVKLRPSKKGEPWDFTLWFKSDNPPAQEVNKAKHIVGRFLPAQWFNNLTYKTTD